MSSVMRKKHIVFSNNNDDDGNGKVERKPKILSNKRKSAENLQPDGSGHKNSIDSKCRLWRLVVRNLPFKTKKDDLTVIFEKIGPVNELVLPSCKDSRFPTSCAGFAFVQFQRKKDADEALRTLHLSEISGRKITVNWAIPKDAYDTAMHETKKMKKEIKKEDLESSECGEGVALKHELSNKGSEGMVLKHELENDDSDVENQKFDKSEGSSTFVTKSGNSTHLNAEKLTSSKPNIPREDKAVVDGRVIFIRNLSYETTDEALKNALTSYGNVTLAIICRYVGSSHSKGTAFVHFEEAGGANECLTALENDPGIFIEGRRIFGHRAVSKKEAAVMEKDKLEKKPKDKRNLHLLRVGIIRPESTEAAGMSASDAEKRGKLTISAREKLKSLQMFVSPTRLVVHNLPKSLSDKSLRSICFIAAGNLDAKITECRIWRDRSKLFIDGEAPSRGFGFVTFSEHCDALAALKGLNNNSETFTNEKRPIVEFSIENLAALHLRESRLKKCSQVNTSNGMRVSEKSAKDLEETKKHLSKGGRKPLPTHFGPKIRQRHMTGINKSSVTAKKNKRLSKNSVAAKGKNMRGGKRSMNRKKSDVAQKKRKMSSAKELTKYLTMSGGK